MLTITYKNMETEITIKILATGNFTESELHDYVLFQIGAGSCSQLNPFVNEEGDADILTVEIL